MVEMDVELFAKNKKLLLTSQYSDLIIECQGYEFKTHRSVVCYADNFFEIAVKEGFKVRILEPGSIKLFSCLQTLQEAREGVIKLPEDDPYVVSQVLLYLYTGQYMNSDPELTAWEDKHVSVTQVEKSCNSRYNFHNAARYGVHLSWIERSKL